MEDNSDTQSSMDESMPEDTFSTQENTVDSTVKTEQQGEEKNTNTSSDLNQLDFLWHLVQIDKIKTRKRRVYLTLLFAIFADFTFMAASEVPEWSMSVDIGSLNLTNNFIHRFEVSPDHSSGETTHNCMVH